MEKFLSSARSFIDSIKKQNLDHFLLDTAKVLFSFVLFGAVIVPLCYAVMSLPDPEVLPDINYFSPNNQVSVITISTTLFTTLFTISLSLLAIAVTTYIFMVDALQSRQPHEQIAIRIMKSRTTKQLILLTALTAICLVLCLFADNGVLDIARTAWLAYSITLASFLNVILLLLFIWTLINHDKCLIRISSEELCNELSKLEGDFLKNTESTPTLEDILKKIGDLEAIVSQLLDNHRSEFDSTSTEKYTISLFEEKLDRNNASSANIHGENYHLLINIRNYIAILRSTSTPNKLLDPTSNPTLFYKTDFTVRSLFTFLNDHVLSQERFENLVLTNICFDNSNLQKTAFLDSSFQKTSFINANLDSSDFRGSLLHSVNFHNSKCKNAIFDDVKFFDLELSPETNFEGALFRNADFNGQVFNETNDSILNFSSTFCARANFVACTMHHVNCDNSIFNSALLSNATLEMCDFSNCGFEDAILVRTKFKAGCNMAYTNLERVTAIASEWNKDSSVDSMLSMKQMRMANGNFTQSVFHNCMIISSYANNASYIDAEFKNCHFDNSIFQNADLTNVKIINCRFKNTDLKNVLLVCTNVDDSIIEGCVFDGSNFSGAEIRGYSFVNCTFNESIFDNALLRNIKFKQCTFNNTQFRNTLLFNVTWRCCSQRGLIRFFHKMEFGSMLDKVRVRRLLNE